MIRQLIRDSVLYLVPNLLARGIGLILLPIYTRYLSTADYGIVELLAVLFALLNLVLPLEISQAVARFSTEAKIDAQRSEYLSTAFWFTGFVFSAWVCLTFAFPVQFSRAILGMEDERFLLQTATAAMLVNALLYLALNQLRWNFQQVPYFIVSLLTALATAGVSVSLVVIYHLGVYGVILGQLVGSGAALSVAVFWLARKSPIRLRFSSRAFKMLLTYSAPLVLSGIAVYATTYIDRWLLNIWIGLDGVGVYSVALRFASILAVATSGVQLAIMPIIYRRYRESQTAESIRRFFHFYLFGGLSLVSAMSIFAEEMVDIVVGPRFHEAQQIVAPVMLAMLIMSLNVFSPGMSIVKRTKRIAMANGVGAVANIVVSALLIPRIGMIGAAIGSMIGAVMIMLLRFTWSQRFYFIPYLWVRYGTAFIVLAVALGFTSTQSPGPALRLLLTAISIAAFGMLLIYRECRPRRLTVNSTLS